MEGILQPNGRGEGGREHVGTDCSLLDIYPESFVRSHEYCEKRRPALEQWIGRG